MYIKLDKNTNLNKIGYTQIIKLVNNLKLCARIYFAKKNQFINEFIFFRKSIFTNAIITQADRNEICKNFSKQ